MTEQVSPTVLVCDRSFVNFGTAFVIARVNTASYLLTCWHVVKSIGEGNLIVRGSQGTVRVIAEDPDLDIAVLGTESPVEGQTLTLDINYKASGSILTARGFWLFGKQIITDSFSVKLEKPTKVQSRSCGEVPAWHISVDDGRDSLKKGFSGAPLFDTGGFVIGIVTQRESTGRAGLAVSVEALRRVWTSAPQAIFETASELGRKQSLVALLEANRRAIVDDDDYLNARVQDLLSGISMLKMAQVEATEEAIRILHLSIERLEKRAVEVAARLEEFQVKSSKANEVKSDLLNSSRELRRAIEADCEAACGIVTSEIEQFYTQLAKISGDWVEEFFKDAWPVILMAQLISRRRLPSLVVKRASVKLSRNSYRLLGDWARERLRPAMLSLGTSLSAKVIAGIHKWFEVLKLTYSDFSPEIVDIFVGKNYVDREYNARYIEVWFESILSTSKVAMLLGRLVEVREHPDSRREPLDRMRIGFAEHVVAKGVDLESKLRTLVVKHALSIFEGLVEAIEFSLEAMQQTSGQKARSEQEIHSLEKLRDKNSDDIRQLAVLELKFRSLLVSEGSSEV